MSEIDKPTIVKLAPAHWQEFRAMRIHALKHEPHLLYGDYKEYAARSKEYWTGLLSDPNTLILGLIVNQKMVGMSAVLPYWQDQSGDVGYLCWNYIMPKFRRCGYGKLLNNARMFWAKHERKYKSLVVCCRQTNVPSQKIYKKTGFHYTHSEMIIYSDGSEDEEYYFKINLDDYDGQAIYEKKDDKND